MSNLYPLFADIDGRCVVVIGGGAVAERKVDGLLASGADILLISPELTDRLCELREEGTIEVRRRRYRPGDIAGASLVLAASDDRSVNQAVFAEAEHLNILCNTVDDPELCNFHVPSVVRRGRLQVAISTGGTSPALAKNLRKDLEKQFGDWYEQLLEYLEDLREHLKEKFPDNQAARSQILNGFVNSPAIELLRCGDLAGFEKLLDQYKGQQ